MKIFNLQSKVNLVAWSVVLGVLADRVLFDAAADVDCSDGRPCTMVAGFPLRYYFSSAEFYPWDVQRLIQNILVWVIFFLAVLSLVRYWRKNSAGVVVKDFSRPSSP